MEEIKSKVLSRLGKLGQVQFPRVSAMDLRGPRPLMSRIGRQESRLYKQKVQEQQRAFKLKLAKIEKYYADLQAEEQRRLAILEDWQGDDEAPSFQPIDVVVPKPVISIPGVPLQRRVRLHSRRRLKKLKRLR